jgi:phosphoribosylglycinamide formyltransferase-1
MYISGKGTRLKDLFESNSLVLKEIALIICDSEDSAYLKEYASNYQIEFVSFNSTKTKGIALAFSDFMLNKFKATKIDYCYCFGIQILKGELIEEYRNRIINFHPSILPMFPGLKSIDQALQAENTILLGNTAHFIDKGIDTGPIIVQSIVPKSYFHEMGYEGILNLQIGMIEFIHTSLLIGAIFFKDKAVFIANSSDNSSLFYNK